MFTIVFAKIERFLISKSSLSAKNAGKRQTPRKKVLRCSFLRGMPDNAADLMKSKIPEGFKKRKHIIELIP